MKKYFASSELIINEDGSVFHLHVKPEWLADKVILVGDPGRVALVASHFENKECEVESREFKTITGTYQGKRITVVSTGIGCDNIDIVMNELDALANIDFETREEKPHLRSLELVRIGTCGGMQPRLVPGTLILPTGAVRMEGTTQEYMPLAFPAVPDFGLTEHRVCAARAAAYDYHTGVVQCKDSFYGQHSPETMPVAPTLLQNSQAWKAAGTLASEMESAALFTVAAAQHVRCATILQMLWNQERQAVVRDKEHAASDMTHAIEVAVAAMRAVIRENKETPV